MKGFNYALNGLKSAFASEMNLKTHVIATLAVLFAGWYLHLSVTEWLIVTGCIGFVLTAELFNTAIEYLVDLVSPAIHPLAGKIKDVSAGAVLIAAITALIAGCIIFLPKVVSRISELNQ
jgi:diacylglycerol kinase